MQADSLPSEPRGSPGYNLFQSPSLVESVCLYSEVGFPWWLSGKEFTCQTGDAVLIPGSERSPGEGNGNPLQYSCLGNPMDTGAWQATVHGVAEKTHTT